MIIDAMEVRKMEKCNVDEKGDKTVVADFYDFRTKRDLLERFRASRNMNYSRGFSLRESYDEERD